MDQDSLPPMPSDSTPPVSPGKTPKHGTGTKETIESILVAFIFAFIFRAFVMEAFVIPTGSMAPTLLGAHMRYRCPDCGYQFDVNYSTREQGDDITIPTEASVSSPVYCPNCGYEVAGGSKSQVEPVLYGDRILVMKYLYLLHPPHRWDVVVFKSPDHPEQYNYTQNYIKRLIGKPGEWVKVLDGDVYVSTDEGRTWQIQRKPYEVQEAVWRIIYDNDHHPVGTTGSTWTQPWKASGPGWDLGKDAASGRMFHFSDSGQQSKVEPGEKSAAIRFDFHANPRQQTDNDYLVYDPEYAQGDPKTVSDLKLSAYYQRTSGQGPLRLNLSRQEKLAHRFTAEITPDAIKLLHHTDLGDSQIGQTIKLADIGLAANDPMFIEFTNVDYQVTLRINGKQILQSTDADYHPDVDWLFAQWQQEAATPEPEVSIDAADQTCSISHLGLWRDIYYTTYRPDADRRRSRGEPPMFWGMPDNPVKLGPGEYFVMGDNSRISEDARFWHDPIHLPNEGLDVPSGRVPEQFLLGRAVFVYWPAGFRPLDSNSSFNPALIPNFGDMHWIH